MLRKLLSLLIIITFFAHYALALEGSPEASGAKSNVNVSLPSEAANRDLQELYQLASAGASHADFDKVIAKANELKSKPEYKRYTQSDQANLNAHMGWVYLQLKDYDSAVKRFTDAMANYSVFEVRNNKITANQLIIASLHTNAANDVFEKIIIPYFLQATDIVEQVKIAEIYSQQNRLDLALRLYELIDEKSKTTNDFDRYIYYAYLVKSLTYNNQQEKLKALAIRYEQEGKNVSWESLIAWQMENENSHFPIERHTPVYPKQAIAEGIVGYAVVEFSIDAKGRTQNQKVIEEFPAGVFASPSLKAIKKFKYAPILGPDGKVIERDQVTNKFTFTL